MRILRDAADLIGAAGRPTEIELTVTTRASQTGTPTVEWPRQMHRRPVMRAALRATCEPQPSRTGLRHEDHLSILNTISSTVSQTLDLQLVLDTALRTVVDVVKFDWGIVLLSSEDGSRLEQRAQVGLSAAYAAQFPVLRPGEGVAGRAWQAKELIVVNDAAADDRLALGNKGAADEGIASFIAVPITSHDIVHGVLDLGTRDRRRFSAEELGLFRTIANQIGIAIENAKLYESERLVARQLRDLNSVIDAQRLQLEQVLSIHNNLTRLVLNGKGLDAIVTKLARLLGNPVVLQDPSFNTLACSHPDLELGIPADGEKIATRAADASPIAELRKNHAPGDSGTRIAVAVVGGGHVRGYLSVVEMQRALTSLDQMAAEQAALACALIIFKEEAIWEVERRLEGDLVNGLLAGDPQPMDEIIRRAALLGHDLAKPHWIVVVQPRQDAQGGQLGRADLADVVQKTMVRFGNNALVGRRGNLVVALVSASSFDGSHDERLDAAIASLVDRADAEDSDVVVSVIGPSSAPTDYHNKYRTAIQAVAISRAAGLSSNVIYANELGFLTLLLSADDPDRLVSFSDSILAPIDRYDAAHEAALAQTLVAFIDNDGSVERTARALHLHANTVKYRLQKIADLSGLDVRRSEDRFRAQLSLKIRAAFAVARSWPDRAETRGAARPTPQS